MEAPIKISGYEKPDNEAAAGISVMMGEEVVDFDHMASSKQSSG